MREWWLLPLLLLAACSEETAAPPRNTAWPVDGFLRLLPPDVSVVVRLPSFRAVERDPEAHRAILRVFGREGEDLHAVFHGAAQPDGIDPGVAPGFARTGAGAWVHYLPARDKARLNRALGPLGTVREEGSWIMLAKGGKGPGFFEDDPLLPGGPALRVRHHPLLAAVAQPGDTLDLSFRLGGGGFDFRGRLRPAADGPTARLLGDARAGRGGLVDFMPGSLGLRVETTLPPTLFATWLARRLGAHCSMREEAERVLLERVLREALTGVDPETGLAFGLEFRSGAASFVAFGKLADGPPSPVLSKVRKRGRSAFGALVLDARQIEGALGFRAWMAGAEASLEGLPEAAWPLVAGLTGGEEQGLRLAYAEQEGWFVLGGGPRGDVLAGDVERRLEAGSRRSPGSIALRAARDRGDGDYVLGIVVEASGFGGLPPADRAALRDAFGAAEGARPPETLAVAGFRSGETVAIEGRALYANP